MPSKAQACDSADACALDLSVYSSSDTDGAVTPNNALRNRALTMSTTEVSTQSKPDSCQACGKASLAHVYTR